ncbi:MAG: methionyl-tRNA formyltransferase [Candidatus Aminicenantales bacterium]
MKIVFFGSPASALPSLEKLIKEGHDVCLVVTQPDRPKGRGRNPSPPPVKKMAMEHGIPCLQPLKIKKDLQTARTIKAYAPELIVVVAYGQIIPSSIIYLPRYNSLNVHFSLLPKYRGASPVQWAILNGEKKTGVTIFQLNEKMDEGDILTWEEVEIFPQEKAVELETRLARKGAELLSSTIARIDTLVPCKQDHSQATYAPKLKKEDGRIDWGRSASFIDRQVRALNPWPSTFTHLGERLIKITEGNNILSETKSRPPGTIQAVRKDGIEVCCGEKSVYLVRKLQPENKREMEAYAFSLGARLKPGDKFVQFEDNERRGAGKKL